MTEHLSSPQCSDKLERPQQFPVKLMEYPSQTFVLAQKINQIVLHWQETQTLLGQVAQALGEAFRVDCCCVFTLFDENSHPGATAHWCAERHSQMRAPQQLVSIRPIDLQVVRFASEALTLNDVQTIESTLLTNCQHLSIPVKAVLTIPTCLGGKNNGVITLIRTQPYYWSEAEKECLRTVAPTVALAISHVKQTQLIASAQQKVQKCNQYESLINQLTQASRSNLELNQFIQRAIASTAQTLQVERGLLLLLKYADPFSKSGQDTPKAKVTLVGEWSDSSYTRKSKKASKNKLTAAPQSFWLSDCSLCQQAFVKAAQPTIISNLQDIEAFTTGQSKVASLFNITLLPSLLFMPLESEGKILGFLVLQEPLGRYWQPEELKVLDTISALVSTAITGQQKIQHLENLLEERSTQLQVSIEVQSKFEEQRRQDLDQLRQLNKLKEEFMSAVSHELNTPLTIMKLAILMLRQPTQGPEHRQKYLDILEQQCIRETKLVGDLLTFKSLLESHQAPLKLQTIDLNPRIRDSVKSLTQSWSDKELKIALDLPEPSLAIKTDTDSLDRILQELLTNAGKYSASETTVVLKVTEKLNQKTQQVEQIVLSLTNIGRGISPEDAKHVFDKFWRGEGVTQEAIPGTGLGLALVKSLVQHLQGEIVVTSNPLDDSSLSEICFTVTLPQNFDHDSRTNSSSE
jgi:signal transduction histidine kinase